jgi:hypothetical protein
VVVETKLYDDPADLYMENSLGVNPEVAVHCKSTPFAPTMPVIFSIGAGASVEMAVPHFCNEILLEPFG